MRQGDETGGGKREGVVEGDERHKTVGTINGLQIDKIPERRRCIHK